MNRLKFLALRVAIALALTARSEAIIFLDAADASHNTSTPGDNSGWQYEGEFNGFLGVPIAPHYFITARHIGGNAGDVLSFHGDLYTTIGYQDIPTGVPPALPEDPIPLTDLRVWEVQHSKPFPTYAAISTHEEPEYDYSGVPAAVFGRGAWQGDPFMLSGEPKGWLWGESGYVKRWGRNVISGTVVDPDLGDFLQCDFDNPGVANECHLSVGDSGGGVFVLEDGLWKLAGINYAVDGPFRVPPDGTAFNAALFDCRGLEYQSGNTWVPVPASTENVASSFYSSRVASSLGWIRTHVGIEVDSLASENFSAWEKLYFSPSEIADLAVSGPLEDPDGDGIGNLLEFALNLDPAFNERPTITPASGLRGLPASKLETNVDERLTMEFVRRTPGSGAGLTYVAEFSSDLSDWQAVGTETSAPINSRWERVKITDSQTTNDSVKRFVRLRVLLPE